LASACGASQDDSVRMDGGREGLTYGTAGLELVERGGHDGVGRVMWGWCVVCGRCTVNVDESVSLSRGNFC
jgi:hypothetical protein